MIAYVTYCSSNKKTDTGMLPPIDRYDSQRIRTVYKRALADGVRFFILSGEYGLLAPEDKIPYYDHLLVSGEVEKLGFIIAHQMTSLEIKTITYFTHPPDGPLRPYFDAIVTACKISRVEFKIKLMLNGV